MKANLFGVLHCFVHCTGHIKMGRCRDRENQYMQLAKVLYCKLPTISKQLPTFQGLEFEPLTSEVGDECVTTAQLWPLKII